MSGMTGKIKVYIFDELGDIGDVRSWELRGDLESEEELAAWQAAKISRIEKEYGDRWCETSGWEWDESQLYNPAKKAAEEEARYKYFMENIYEDCYPEYDPGDAYMEWLSDQRGGIYPD